MPEYGNPWPVPITHNGEGMNMAKWVGTYEDWATKMMMMGYSVDDLTGIAAQSGEIFPKNLVASIKAKNTLFPGADMLYRYDLQNHMKQSYDHNNAEGHVGPGDWVPMDPSEIAAADQYNSWANNPGNAGYEAAFGNNNYNAWLAASRGSGPRAAGAQGPNGSLSSLFPGATNPTPHIQSLGTQGQEFTSGAGAQGTLGSMLGQNPKPVLGLGERQTDPLSGSGTLGSLMSLPDENKQWNGGQYGSV